MASLPSKERMILIAGVGLDVLLVLAVLIIRWHAQPGAVPDPNSVPGIGDLPAWYWEVGWLGDWMLFPGPDAGNWAINIQTWIDGGILDHNRPPLYTILTGLATPAVGDLVFAGHMVNHLLSLLFCFLAYAFGRATSGRGAAMGAALLVALSPDLVMNKGFFGVDPILRFTVLLLAVTTWWAANGRWWRLIVTGLAAGLTAGAHFISMAFVLPAAMLLVLSDPPVSTRLWKWLQRLLGPALVLGIGYLIWRLMMISYPPLELWQVSDIYSEGIATYSGQHHQDVLSITDAVGMALSKLSGALGIAAQQGLKPLDVLPFQWPVLLALCLLGIVGPGLRPRPCSRLGWDWRPALWLLLFLTPLVGLAATQSPKRYFLYSIPFVFLAAMRGMASLAAGVDYLATKKIPRWPRGVVAIVACLLAAVWIGSAFTQYWNLYSPMDRARYNHQVAAAVKKHFGKGECIVTRSQEVLFLSGRPGCPTAPCAQYVTRKLLPCVNFILKQCTEDEYIPYVLKESRFSGPGDRPNEAMEALVRKNFKAVASVRYQDTTSRIYRMKREVLEDLVLGQPASVLSPAPEGLPLPNPKAPSKPFSRE